MNKFNTSIGGVVLPGYSFIAAGAKVARYEELVPIALSDSAAIRIFFANDLQKPVRANA